MAKTKSSVLRPGTRVRVRGCESGTAVVRKFIRSFDVYLLDQQMTIRYPSEIPGADLFVSYWTFPRSSLVRVSAHKHNGTRKMGGREEGRG